MKEARHFEAPITEIIRKRTSVRSYEPHPLPSPVRSNLEAYAHTLEGPFAPGVRFVFFDSHSFLAKSGRKVGTYGFIKGANDYIAGIVEIGAYHLEQLGYVFEQLILYATSLDVGTCWLGGTFKRSDFEKAAELRNNEMLPAVTPVGYASKRERWLGSAIKISSGSKKRKPWAELFFQRGLHTALGPEEAGPFKEPLEMVRLAPSASNRQPWRIVKDGPYWHFYLNYSPLLNKPLGFDIQRIDMGIALCHFELTASELGLPGEWVAFEESPSIPGTAKLRYIISWKEGASAN